MTNYVSPTYQDGQQVDAALDLARSALQASHIDTDQSQQALHHTLGTGANQAAAGDHTHAAASIVSGYISPDRLGSGTPDDNVWLRGDGKWTAVVGPGSGGTDLSIANRGPASLDVASSTGAAATIPEATITHAGLMSAADWQKLDGVAPNATALVLGTTAGTACEGNDPRLSDSRVPLAHTHATNKLLQLNTHEAADTDSSLTAIHHTLGTGAFQAAVGNHTHSGFEATQTPVTQAEAEAGTGTVVRSWTPQRVSQAIQALALNSAAEVVSAIEANLSARRSLQRLLGISFDPTAAAAGVPPTLDLDFERQVYRHYTPTLGLREYSLSELVSISRATVATNTGGRAFINTSAINAARIEFNPQTRVCRGLLIEEARQNRLAYSEDFSVAPWIPVRLLAFGSGSVVNAIMAPDGAMTADKIVEDTQNGTRNVSAPFSSVDNEIVTGSAFVKPAGRTKASLEFILRKDVDTRVSALYDLTAGTVLSVSSGYGAGVVPYPDGWMRLWLRGSVGAGAKQSRLYVFLVDDAGNRTYTGNGTSGVYLWGAQAELGRYLTSYIYSGGTATTRADEQSVLLPAKFSDCFRAGPGTLLATVTPLSWGDVAPFAVLDDATTNNSIALRGNAASPELYVRSGGVDQAQISAGSLVAGDRSTLVGGWADNDCAASINGGVPVVDSSATIPLVTQLRIGFDGTTSCNGSLGRICYWPFRLPNSALQTLSAS